MTTLLILNLQSLGDINGSSIEGWLDSRRAHRCSPGTICRPGTRLTCARGGQQALETSVYLLLPSGRIATIWPVSRWSRAEPSGSSLFMVGPEMALRLLASISHSGNG